MEKFCQSCAMPLNSTNQGTEANGSKSTKYCSNCYQNGAFINPNITFEEMVKIGKDGIDASNMNAVKKFFLKASYPSMLKKVERFKWLTSLPRSAGYIHMC